jgi:hypothetical protein
VNHRLIPDAEERLESFDQMVGKTIEFLQFQKKQEITHISRSVLLSRQSMIQLKELKQVRGIVDQMINLSNIKDDVSVKLNLFDCVAITDLEN